MTTVASFPSIGAHDKAMQLYGYRRFASNPGFVNHTPRDTIPSPEVQDFKDFANRVDVPRHLDLTLTAAARASYWSEDEQNKKKAHFAASTRSQSAPTSPVEERKTFLQPRAPQYETNDTTADVAHFLRETAPVPKLNSEEAKPQRAPSMNRKKSLVRKTARRVLEAGNRQLPEQCQLPQWQRAPSPERPPVVERKARSGKRYYQIVPGTANMAEQEQIQSERGTTRTDWTSQHRAEQYTVRARHTPARRQVRTTNTDEETTDAYATLSDNEGPWIEQGLYEPGTALGDPYLQDYIQGRQSSGDSAMGMLGESSVATVDSRIADSELTDNEMYSRAPSAELAVSNPATTYKPSYRPNHASRSRTSVGSGHTQVLCEGGRPVSQVLPSQGGRRSLSPDRFQTTLNSFPNTPSNLPTRNSSIKTYAPTQEVKSVASALQARADRARARKMRDLQSVRMRSAGSEGSMNAPNARTSSEAVSGAPESAFDHSQAQRIRKGKAPATSTETCPHGFDVCPHGCKHGHIELYHPNEIAYRAALPLPILPSHPALRNPDWSPSDSMPPPLRTTNRSIYTTNRSRANSNTTSVLPPPPSVTDERDIQIQILQSQIDELRQRDARMNAALALLTSASTGSQCDPMSMPHLANLFSSSSSGAQTHGLPHTNAQTVSAAAAAGAAAGVAAAQAQQAMQLHHRQQQHKQRLSTRNDSTNSKTSITSDKRTSGESGMEAMSFTSVEDGGAYQNKSGATTEQSHAQGQNVLDMYMVTTKCSLTPPLEE